MKLAWMVKDIQVLFALLLKECHTAMEYYQKGTGGGPSVLDFFN